MQQKHLALRLRERTSQQITMSTTQQALARSSTTTQLLATLSRMADCHIAGCELCIWRSIVQLSNGLACTRRSWLTNAGTSVGTLTDIDGDSRSTSTPDVGADEYSPLTCFGISALTAANVTSVGFDATWTSNNSSTIGVQVRHRLSSGPGAWTITAGTGTSVSISGLSPATSYDYSAREICAVGDTCVWSAR